MMGWHGFDGGWWTMGIGMIAWILVLAVLIGVVVWVINRSSAPRSDEPRGESPEEILRRRFAAGEIDEEDYARRLATLRS